MFYDNLYKKAVLQASVGVTPPEKVDVIQNHLFWLTYNVNNLNTQCKRSLPRKARSHGKVYIKRIMLYCWIYVHAPREMKVHLTRCACAQYITTKWFIDILGYNKTTHFVSHPPKVGSHLPMFTKKPAFLCNNLN